jgi:hypothetical protein
MGLFTLMSKCGLIVIANRPLDALLHMPHVARVHVLIPNADADRFDAYCKAKGFKKSTLIVRLIREHMDRERFEAQSDMFKRPTRREPEP